MRQLCRLRPLPFLCCLVFCSILSSCNFFPKLQTTATNSLAQGVQKARIDSIMQATADSVLTEMMKSKRFQSLRFQLDTILGQSKDTILHATDSLLNHALRQFTNQWMPGMNRQVQQMISDSKANLTDDQIKNYIKDLIKKDLPEAFNGFIDQMLLRIRSKEFKQNLIDLQHLLSLQMDTLARSATRGAVSEINDSLMPKLNKLVDLLAKERDKTQQGIGSLIWEILAGVILVMLVAFLARTYYIKLKYRKMLQLITAEVDKIDSQSEYDKLVKRVSDQMKAQGLEETLRTDILQEQGLIEQKKWQEKDAQLLRLLIKEMDAKNLTDAEIKDKLKEYGLEQHFESVKRSLQV